MSGFAVIRHTETGGLGTSPAEAMELHCANGWVRVSEYAPSPGTFNLPDFADAPDLDARSEVAPDSEPAPDAKATTKKPKE